MECYYWFTGRSNIFNIRVEEDDNHSVSSIFDPDHPFAFSPPDYDSLPKDPPAYMELFGVSDNPSFVGDDEGSRPHTPAPPYCEVEEPQGETGNIDLSDCGGPSSSPSTSNHQDSSDIDTVNHERTESVKSSKTSMSLKSTKRTMPQGELQRVRQGLGLDTPATTISGTTSGTTTGDDVITVTLPGHADNTKHTDEPIASTSTNSHFDVPSEETSSDNPISVRSTTGIHLV